MKLCFYRFFIATLLFLTSSLFAVASSKITYQNGGGRFGDQLLCYMHAKWISYKYKMPLLYRKFGFSEELMLSVLERKLPNRVVTTPFIAAEFNPMNRRNAKVYEVAYFPLSEYENEIWEKQFGRYYFDVDWDDIGFKKELQKCIRPINELRLVELPDNIITVGMHIRRGKEYDGDHMEFYYPLKFPPEQFYIDELRHLYHYLGKRPLYVYLFTDDSTTNELLKIFEQNFSGEKIEFHTRLIDNHHTAHVLEDFFSMMKFDCLIHAESNFSYTASLIGDFAVRIRPTKFHFEDKKLVIDEVDFKVENSRLQRRLYEVNW